LKENGFVVAAFRAMMFRCPGQSWVRYYVSDYVSELTGKKRIMADLGI